MYSTYVPMRQSRVAPSGLVCGIDFFGMSLQLWRAALKDAGEYAAMRNAAHE